MSDVRDNASRHRYELEVEGALAIAAYHDEGNVRAFTHTEVPSALGGRGIGTRLIAAALQDVRAKGMRVRPLCPFVSDYIAKNPDFADLVAA